jgi:hypothetical protein
LVAHEYELGKLCDMLNTERLQSAKSVVDLSELLPDSLKGVAIGHEAGIVVGREVLLILFWQGLHPASHLHKDDFGLLILGLLT